MFYFISFNFCLEISGLRLLKGARRKLVSFVIATQNEKVYMFTAAPFILSIQVEEKIPFHLILSFQNVSLTTTEEKICLPSLSGKLISKFDVLTKSNSLEHGSLRRLKTGFELRTLSPKLRQLRQLRLSPKKSRISDSRLQPSLKK